MPEPNPSFEVIEEPPYEPSKAKRKPKRKARLAVMPWRWLVVAFVVGGALILSTVLWIVPQPSPVSSIVTVATVAPAIQPTGPALRPTQSAGVEYIRAMAWAGDKMAAVGSESLRLYQSQQPVQFLDPYVNTSMAAAAIHPAGSQLVTLTEVGSPTTSRFDHVLTLWDLSTRQMAHQIVIHTNGSLMTFFGSPGVALAYSPDGSLLATGSMEGEIVLWNPVTGERRSTITTKGIATLALAFSADHQRLLAVTRYGDKTIGSFSHDEIQGWDIRQPDAPKAVATTKLEISPEYIFKVAFSPNGLYAVFTTQSGNVQVWDVERGRALGTIALGSVVFQDVALNLDGRHIALAMQGADTAGRYAELQVLTWYFKDGGTFGYNKLRGKKDYLSLSDINHLHFDSTGNSNVLAYISVADNRLGRWNLDTDRTEMVNFW
jgi:WD40 repeat protein